jgi:polyribonucleotide nucleotidyltransferase
MANLDSYNISSFSMKFEGKELTVELNNIAEQSHNAVVIRYDNNVIMTSLIIGEETKIGDFLPLTINLPENLFAIANIPGGFNKREGRGSDYAILVSRIVDRSIRPMLKDIFQEIQITINVWSLATLKDLE